jgi:hypothetical protein
MSVGDIGFEATISRTTERRRIGRSDVSDPEPDPLESVPNAASI